MHAETYTDAELERIRVNSLEAPYEPNADFIPDKWDREHLARRIEEAFRTINKGSVPRPKAYGAMWPEYTHEFAEVVGWLDDSTVPHNVRAIGLPSREHLSGAPEPAPSMIEVTRAEAVMDWLLRMASLDPIGSEAIQRWAEAKSRNYKKMGLIAKRFGWGKQRFYEVVNESISNLANYLNSHGAGVF